MILEEYERRRELKKETEREYYAESDEGKEKKKR